MNRLHLAVMSNNFQYVRYVLLRFQDIDVDELTSQYRSALHHACRRGNLDVISLLLQVGADPNILDDQDQSPMIYFFHGNTTDNPWVIHELMTYGASFFIYDINGHNSIHLAAKKSFNGSLETLLSFGCFPDHVDPQGRTGLHLAVFAENTEGVKLLITYHANVNFADYDGKYYPFLFN